MPNETLPAASQSTRRVEAAPQLRSQHHEETIVCFQLDPASNQAFVHQPKIELRRGTVLDINSSKTVKLGNRTYLQITRCETQPQAEGLYIRQEEVIESPPNITSKPVRAPDKLNLRKITRANKAGKPIMELSGVKLEAGSPFRVSGVHRVTDADQGNGVIDADGNVDYLLITECLQNPSAPGLFVQVVDVLPLSEEDYAKEINRLKLAADQPKFQRVRVMPKEGESVAVLFRDMSQSEKKAAQKLKAGELPIQKSPADTIAATTELVVETAITVSREKEYYRILECPSNPAFVGLYLLAKEAMPILDVPG